MLYPDHRTNQRRRRAPHLNRIAATMLAVSAALAAVAGLALTPHAALAGGDAGPDTCLNGYVWREATPADHVCVTPPVRDQTARDNARAAERRSPTGGPYGPNTCLQGYVWRAALASDLVCVEPRVRDQAQDDNQRAATRRNELRTAVSTYRRQTRTCSGGVCSITSDDAARYRLRADRLNVGTARVILVETATRRVLKSWRVPVAQHSTAPGGYLSLATGVLQCSARGTYTPNGYFRVQDGSSGRWSSRQYVWIGCKTL